MLGELGFQRRLSDPGPEALVVTPGLKRLGQDIAGSGDSLGKSLAA